MSNFFSSNLKMLTDKYTQKYVAEKTGFSQSSINNYLSKNSEPSMQFLIALKNAFGICVDDFLFSVYKENENDNKEKFFGNYIVYYYNNSSYKGEIHTNLKNTLNYGVISITKQTNVVVYGSFVKEKVEAIKMLNKVNSLKNNEIADFYSQKDSYYEGNINTNLENIFISMINSRKDDEVFIILNNPSFKDKYLGGLGTINSVSRGREHNPCVQYVILSKFVIDRPDGEIYSRLSLDYTDVDFDTPVSDLISLFKRLYVEQNELSSELNENQKEAIIENKLKYYFNEIVEANMFRFSKISNHEDDMIYRLLKEGVDARWSW